MKHRLQTRLQVATDNFLCDTVSNRSRQARLREASASKPLMTCRITAREMEEGPSRSAIRC
jgi:hypothetical protein